MTAAFNPLDYPIAFETPRLLTSKSAWNEHLPFGMLLMQLARPRTVVELGTHAGGSYCGFCQSIAAAGLDTRCMAVDTWKGDVDAGYYGEEVLQRLRAHHDPLYGNFSVLNRKTFDEALLEVPDGSIDVLHIDGLHSYEAVKHDFDTWLPKVSDRGVILFHDTAVTGRGFGVHRLWDELQAEYDGFNFQHGFGLGVLPVGASVPRPVSDLLAAAIARPHVFLTLFAALGARIQRLCEQADPPEPVATPAVDAGAQTGRGSIRAAVRQIFTRLPGGSSL